MDNRRSGRSTRLADNYIQKLFTERSIEVFDHYAGEFGGPTFTPSSSGDNHLFNVICSRLNNEHGGIINFKIDKSRRVIKLKNHDK